MRRTVATMALVLATSCACFAGAASARAVLGMGDQKPTLFSDPRFTWLRLHDARIVVSWDVMASKGERTWADAWLRAARRDRVRPLVTFGHGWTGPSRRGVPGGAPLPPALARFPPAVPGGRGGSAGDEGH